MILLDTCTLLWLVTSPEQLSERAQVIFSESEENRFFSAISSFEIGLKMRKRQIQLPTPFFSWIEKAKNKYLLQELVVNSEIAYFSTQLPLIHKDPSDRILIATAQIHKLTLLTPDPFIRQYPDVKVEW